MWRPNWTRAFPLEYNAAKDPNYLSFIAVDSTGDKDESSLQEWEILKTLQISERLVLEGKFNERSF